MKPLTTILQKKRIKRKKKNKGGNRNWLLAKQFSDYIGLSTPFVLKLFKQFGIIRVLSLRFYLKDYPRKDHKKLPGLVIFLLKKRILE